MLLELIISSLALVTQDWWTEEYALESSGILNAPRVLKPGKEVSRLPQRRG
jgi:hypothetical protein